MMQWTIELDNYIMVYGNIAMQWRVKSGVLFERQWTEKQDKNYIFVDN